MKKYYNKEDVIKFESHKNCPECNGICLFKDGNWVWIYVCGSCSSTFEYVPTDMGQSLASLTKIDKIPNKFI